MSHLQFDKESPVWRQWTDGLSAQNQFVRYDDRGHGLSDRETEDLSLDILVADLEHVVDAAKLERFALLGISHGCAVSIAYAARHPDRVSHLVLCGGYSRGWQMRGEADDIALHSAMKALIGRGWGSDNPAFRHLFAALLVPGATQRQLDTLVDHQRRTASPASAARLYQAFGDIDVSALLDQVEAPTLVFHAREDQAVPHECGQIIADGIAGARLVTLETGNHMLLEGEPAFVRAIDELRAFVGKSRLRSCPTAPTAARLRCSRSISSIRSMPLRRWIRNWSCGRSIRFWSRPLRSLSRPAGSSARPRRPASSSFSTGTTETESCHCRLPRRAGHQVQARASIGRHRARQHRP